MIVIFRNVSTAQNDVKAHAIRYFTKDVALTGRSGTSGNQH